MNNDHTRDLVWWRIPRWVPTTPRVLATGLVIALVSGLVFWLVGGAVIPAIEFLLGLWIGLVAWLVGGGAGRVVVRLGGGEPQRVRTMNWRAFRARPVLRSAVVFGLVGGLIFDFVVVLALELTSDQPGHELFVLGLVGGLVWSLMFGLVAWLVLGLVRGLVGRDSSEGSPVGPRESGRHDRVFGLMGGLLFGLVFGLLFGLPAGFDYGPLRGLRLGLTSGLVFGLAFGLEVSLVWQTTLVWLQLHLSRRVPAVALMPFLEDAQARGVLRTVGAVYQFRHATLQDQLAGQTTPSPATSPVAEGAS